MRKWVSLFKDAVKALVGTFAIIGFMEVLNVIISVVVGQYIRIDEGVLENVINDYIFYGELGYGITWIVICYNRIQKDINKDVVQKTKSLVIQTWIILVIITLIVGILTLNLKLTIFGITSYSAIFGLALLILYLIDKKLINEINKKIKEQNK